jgi:hypothetical protein
MRDEQDGHHQLADQLARAQGAQVCCCAGVCPGSLPKEGDAVLTAVLVAVLFTTLLLGTAEGTTAGADEHKSSWFVPNAG